MANNNDIACGVCNIVLGSAYNWCIFVCLSSAYNLDVFKKLEVVIQ